MAHGRSPTHRRKGRAREPWPQESATGSPVRIQKILAAAGMASRRASEELIRQGRVLVDGKRVKLGDTADPDRQVVAVDGERIRPAPRRYWLLHKPTGVMTTLRDPHGRQTVMDLLPEGLGRLHPVGRLDRYSSGLLLMTNDGALTQALLHPSHGGEKEYEVTARGALSESAVRKLTRGMHLEDGRTAPAGVSAVRFDADRFQTSFRLTLTEGRKRQIRRMLQNLGYPVKKLVRVRIGPLTLGRLAPGRARPLRARELSALQAYARRLGRTSRDGPRTSRRRGRVISRSGQTITPRKGRRT